MIFPVLLWLYCPAFLVTARFHPPNGFTSHYHEIAPFHTEPKFDPEQFNIIQEVKDRSQLSPGYLFIDPIWRSGGFGPQIYDTDGTLIWHGVHRNRSQNLHVCDFQGKPGYLCTSNRAGGGPLPKSLPLPPGVETIHSTFPINEVLDNTYNSVGRYREGHDGLPFNIHAFEMSKGGMSFTTIVAKPHVMDLTPFGGPKVGWVRNQCIDEIDTKTKKSLFHWCYLEGGLKVWETQAFFVQFNKASTNTSFGKAGSGTRNSPWDFLHVNAVAKNSQGDFYISVRYLDQVIKVAGPKSPNGSPGTVLWRLGGKGNNFQFEGFHATTPFSRPHDVRSISVSPKSSVEVITLFNNAWEGAVKPSQGSSEAQVISINTKKMTARLSRGYPHPHFGHATAQGRGSVQILPNENVMVGWGALPHISEFDKNGTLLYHASFGRRAQANPEFSYRALKSPWIGKPHWDPILVAYSPTCDSSTITTYTSWNGATEVRYWGFFTAKSVHGPWLQAGIYPKQGFETKITLKSSILLGFTSQVYVQAIDADGNVLGATMSATFVPILKKQHLCGAEGCEPRFAYTNNFSRAQKCSSQDMFPYLLLALLIIFMEAAVGLCQRMSRLSVGIAVYSKLQFDEEPWSTCDYNEECDIGKRIKLG